jgi:hypothetical protein
MNEFEKALDQSRDQFGHYECGHCGEMFNLTTIDFGQSRKRTLCSRCITLILEWI